METWSFGVGVSRNLKSWRKVHESILRNKSTSGIQGREFTLGNFLKGHILLVLTFGSQYFCHMNLSHLRSRGWYHQTYVPVPPGQIV